MFPLLSSILIVNPLILTALIALPILWFLLRVTPPAPRLVKFPATRFLAGLMPEQVTPSKTPWWLLLLRIIIAALVILALAHPVYNPSKNLRASGNIRLVMNNDWAGAQNWDRMTKAASEVLAQAEREKRNVIFIATADYTDANKNQSFPLVSASEASALLKGLKPKPWSSNYEALEHILTNTPSKDQYSNIVLSSGLKNEGFDEFLSALSRDGSVLFYKMEDQNLPVIIKTPEEFSMDLKARILTPDNIPDGINLSAQARSENGRILNVQNIQTKAAQNSYEVSFDIPELIRNDVGQFSVAGRRSAASTYLLGDRFSKRSVGIVAEEDETDSATSLTEAATYISKAIEPFSIVTFGTINAVLDSDPSMIILPDIGAIPSQTLNTLEEWIEEGGLLVRFAGPNMMESINTPYLVPVPIRSGTRSLEGSLSWEKPLGLKDFHAESPFYGIEISPDITIKRQVLADPIPDLDKKTWARLEDGTPLITADKMGAGLVVLIHTTASPDWSNLSLSGLFVNILKRLVDLSGKASSQAFTQNSTLDPLYVMDGFGMLRQADSSIKPIAPQDFDSVEISPQHPPGIYGHGGVQQILNLGDRIETIETVSSLPMHFSVQHYDKNYERDLRPYLLFTAIALLFIDWLIMLLLSLGLRSFRSQTVLPVLAALSMIAPWGQAHAQTPIMDTNDQYQYADDLYLAYIKTGDASLDKITQDGLEVLVRVLTRRTSAEPAGVVGLSPESDILPFFPLIYWPIHSGAAALTPQAIENVQQYLDNGGTILFDTRDQNFTAGELGGTPNADTLRKLVANLNIPPLEPAAEDHVLTKSFYLLDQFPGNYSGGTLWVESDGANGRDGVSSILIGSHDWAGSWAKSASNRRTIYGTTRQDELSLRFGVNLMMYALTGNYKADQVHVPHILERLGQ